MKKYKIFAACALFLFALAGCDLEGLNVNPNEPTDDVDYNLNDPRLASTLRNGIPMEGDDEQRVKSLMIDFFAQIADGGNFSTKNYIMNEDWNRRMYRRVQSNVSSLNIVIRNLSADAD
ncbi:SusD/RagB family nutrient-binding outer membrane lipoprotein, partial [Bacteroides sp. OttesenSCG-928-J23]|nr:SusD/RagB family nutrient-binding outer membrane lipoprotein [Bacteroides sp. OttesenSCG-928-J23]